MILPRKGGGSPGVLMVLYSNKNANAHAHTQPHTDALDVLLGKPEVLRRSARRWWQRAW